MPKSKETVAWLQDFREANPLEKPVIRPNRPRSRPRKNPQAALRGRGRERGRERLCRHCTPSARQSSPAMMLQSLFLCTNFAAVVQREGATRRVGQVRRDNPPAGLGVEECQARPSNGSSFALRRMERPFSARLLAQTLRWSYWSTRRNDIVETRIRCPRRDETRPRLWPPVRIKLMDEGDHAWRLFRN